MTLDQIAKEIGRTQVQTRKILAKLGFVGMKSRKYRSHHFTYEAQALEVIKALLSVPHREVGNHSDDWLSQFIAGQPLEGETRE